MSSFGIGLIGYSTVSNGPQDLNRFAYNQSSQHWPMTASQNLPSEMIGEILKKELGFGTLHEAVHTVPEIYREWKA